jgi:hypothetical protein
MEIIQSLIMRQIIYLIIEVKTDAPNGTGISFDRLRLQPLESQVFAVKLIIVVELDIS